MGGACRNDCINDTVRPLMLLLIQNTRYSSDPQRLRFFCSRPDEDPRLMLTMESPDEDQRSHAPFTLARLSLFTALPWQPAIPLFLQSLHGYRSALIHKRCLGNATPAH